MDTPNFSLRIDGAEVFAALFQRIDQLEKKIDELRPASNEDEVISKKEALELLGVTASTLWRWVKDGKIKETALGGKRYFSRSEIMDLIK